MGKREANFVVRNTIAPNKKTQNNILRVQIKDVADKKLISNEMAIEKASRTKFQHPYAIMLKK